MKRGGRLPPRSKKRADELEERRAVVAQALARDGGCVARELVPHVQCWGPFDGDERISRKRWPGGHLVLDNVQTLCRAHHDWKTTHDEDAIVLGLSAHSWDR